MAADIASLAAPGARAIAPYQPGKPIEELERELGIQHAVKLASNENPLGPSPLALAAVRAALDGVALYPDGSGFLLKRKLSTKLNVPIEGHHARQRLERYSRFRRARVRHRRKRGGILGTRVRDLSDPDPGCRRPRRDGSGEALGHRSCRPASGSWPEDAPGVYRQSQ